MAYVPEHGDVWLNESRKELKFHLDGVNYSLHPSSWYVAGEAISKGDIVSIADATWQPTGAGKAFLTDTENTNKTVGIALNAAILDEPVEVLSQGLFTWDTNIFLVSDIGKIAYVKITPDGELTTDRNAAVLGSNQLVEVGLVVSQDSLFIDLEGDGRGPVDVSQYEYVTDEIIDTSGFPKLVAQMSNGKVVKADRRTTTLKTDVVGFIIGASSGFGGALPADTTVLVQKIGLLDGFSGLTPGKAVYADIDGAVVQNPAALSYYSDTLIPVGTAHSATAIAVMVESGVNNLDSVPIGSIKALPPTATPEYGYLECDGTTLNSVANPEYAALYDVIGLTFGGTGANDFDLPDLTGSTPGFQMKYLPFYQITPPETPIFKLQTDWTEYDVATMPTIDIETTVFGANVPLEELVVDVYVTNGSVTRKLEPQPVVHTYENTGIFYERFGYQVAQITPGFIQLQIADDGLAYFDTSTNDYVSVDGWEYKIIIYKAERWNRFYDYQADDKLYELWLLGLASLSDTYNVQADGKLDRSTTNPVHTTRLNYDGVLYATNVVTTSTKDAKKDIQPLRFKALDILNSVKIVEYTLKEDPTDTRKIGFIAEDTSNLLATPNHDGEDTSNCIGLLIKAVQELQAEINILKGK